MAFDRGRAARAEIEAENSVTGDLYAFLDEEPPPVPPTRSRRSDPGPVGSARRASPRRHTESLDGPLLSHAPLEDLFVFIGEVSPPRRRPPSDIRRKLAEMWWRWTQQRRREQMAEAISADGTLAPDCDYQQLSEGPGNQAVSSTANSFRDFWLSLGGGPIDIGEPFPRQGRRPSWGSAGYAPEGVQSQSRGRGTAPAGLMPQRSQSLFAPRASDRYHVLGDGPSQDPQSEEENDRNYWMPTSEELAMMVRMGELPHIMGDHFNMVGAPWDFSFSQAQMY
mmetsp:Transcript_28494/g.58755  ORF Transcript_28494/g.58755 Transcript_28494/m.58755 type:complete len:280 (+) Transcript_28494:53-892(+)